MPATISVRDLRKSYGQVVAVDGVTFTVGSRASSSASWARITQPAAIVGLILALSGFFFKLALFRSISGRQTYTRGLRTRSPLSDALKMAAAATIRFAGLSAGASPAMIKLLIVMSILSMTFGNLVALIQKDIKRLLAYSSIAHAGYILIGILSLSGRGYASAIYYAAAYLVMNYSVFMVIMKLADDGQKQRHSRNLPACTNAPRFSP